MHRSRLESIDLLDSVTAIGSNAFRDCKKLVNINVPNSLIAIGESAFSGTALPKELIDALHNKVKENGGESK